MFKRNKSTPLPDVRDEANMSAPREQTEEVSDWEEIVWDMEDYDSTPSSRETEATHANADIAPRPTLSDGIGESGEIIDISQFPAFRMAFGHDEPAEPRPEQPIEEYTAETDGEDGLSWLIRRYAELDEQEKASEETAANLTENGEELPELFRSRPAAQHAAPDTQPQEPEQPEEFTMESEILKQRTISGELFEYIDTIESDANSRVRETVQVRAKAAARPYDPYNTQFNSKFDDSEDVLNNTPEIPLTPKYELKDDEE